MAELNNTAHRVLDVAERYTQTHGFNAFSYKDLQNEVGVKTSSIHYYFPTKQDLALKMVERYIDRFNASLNSISNEQSIGLKRLDKLAQVYVDVVKQGKFCMCGMLASDILSLPEAVKSKLCDFFQMIEDWIAEAIELGIAQDDVTESIDIKTTAAHYLASLEGGMLIARTKNEPAYLKAITTEVLVLIKR